MDVFIGNLPPSVTLHDIRSACKKWDFKATFERKTGIYQIGKPYQYFVARFGVNQEKEGQRMIRQLKQLTFLGRRVEAREYINRSYSHERRAVDWRTKPWKGPERRLRERRWEAGSSVAA